MDTQLVTLVLTTQDANIIMQLLSQQVASLQQITSLMDRIKPQIVNQLTESKQKTDV